MKRRLPAFKIISISLAFVAQWNLKYMQILPSERLFSQSTFYPLLIPIFRLLARDVQY